MRVRRILCGALLMCALGFGQTDYELHARRMQGWDPRSREGRCVVHVWVDNRAEVRMRGDSIFVRTLEGSRARDEGSECSQPMPYNFVRDFQLRQTAGRNRIAVAEQPDRRNNFTAMIVIEDPQGGGSSYAFEVSWRSDEDTGRGAAPQPAPFFDDVRACQDVVRQRFLSQNGRGSYLDFERLADRRDGGNAGNGQGFGRGRGRNTETIVGRGVARSRNESRDIEYSCTVDTVRGEVLSGEYRITRGDGRMH